MEIDVQKIKRTIPELPQQKRERFLKEYGLSEKEVEILIKNKKLSDYFEKVVSELKNWIKFEKIPKSQLPVIIKTSANYLESDLLGLIKKEEIAFEDLKVTPENFAELITILWKGEISSRAGKDILLEMFKTGADPTYIIEDKNLKQVSDKGEIEKIAKKAIEENQEAVEDYKKGKENAIQFLVGQVMKGSRGKAHPEEAKKILKSLLDA